MFNPVKLAHEKVATILKHCDFAIDATVGNGHDTIFLANCVGKTGKVLGFDIQEEALANAHALLRESGLSDRVILLKENHARMKEFLPERDGDKIRVAMFNLGYLPGGDKNIATHPEDTISALNAALEFLIPGGVITIVAYNGHPGGQKECQAVEKWISNLNPKK